MFVFRSDAGIYRCGGCSHFFSDPTSLDQPEIYGPEYYERAHRNWFAHPNLPLFSWIASRLPPGTRSVLDVGCGRGDFLRHLRERFGSPLRLMGVDYSPNEPERGIEFKQGDFAKMSGDEQFDVVVSLAVIEHVSNPVDMARALVARCKPGGMVVVMTLDNGSLLYVAARLMARLGIRGPAMRLYSAHHLQHFTTQSLAATLEASGLQVEKVHHHNAPLASIDIPAPNALARTIYKGGVVLLFWFGLVVKKSYLQTIVARRAD